MIDGDSSEYNFITEEIQKLKLDPVVLTCEIGLRRGLGSKTIMDAVISQGVEHYRHVAIDPYGDLKYKHYDDKDPYVCDYNDQMRMATVRELYNYKQFAYFEFLDEYYFETMKKGYPITINGNVYLKETYNVVHLDGPHTSEAVQNEVNFFASRMTDNSLLIIDDYKTMNLQSTRWFLQKIAFEEVRKGERKLIFKRST